jgi:hypothetical protein
LLLSAALSPDGRLVAAGDQHGVLLLWRSATGREVFRLPAHRGPVAALAFSPDGRTLASGGAHDRSLRLWEVATSKERHRLEVSATVMAPVAFSSEGVVLAAAGPESVRLWDVAGGKELAPLRGHHAAITCLAFSGDGQTLATGSGDGTALVWDVHGLPPARPEAGRLTARELEALWADLAGADAARAYRAMRTLSAARKQALPFLQARLLSLSAAAREWLAQLLRDLDDHDFPVRDRATAELIKLGKLAEPALRAAVKGSPSAEVRLRVRVILEKQDDTPAATPEWAPGLRALEVLEQVGTAEARQVLRKLAQAKPETWLTAEAGASLERLARHRPAAP